MTAVRRPRRRPRARPYRRGPAPPGRGPPRRDRSPGTSRRRARHAGPGGSRPPPRRPDGPRGRSENSNSPAPVLEGRDSSLVRLMLRAANSLRIACRLPGRSSRWKQTMLVLSCPVGAGTPRRGQGHEAGLVVRMVLHVGGDDLEAVELGREARRQRGGVWSRLLAHDAGRLGGGVAWPRSRPRGGARPGSAGTAPRPRGNESTRVIASSSVPGRATRWRWMSRTTSRWMSRSTSKTRLSTVAFTAPSIEFSMGTKASVARPLATASRASLSVAAGTRAADA